jgi:hypothetical protein
MLSDFWTFWFGVLQSLGGIATAIALIFVGYQMYYAKSQSEATEEQLKMSRIAQNFTLRPWIYRDPEPADISDRYVPNYKVVRDPEAEINEYCIRVPFHNQGRFHTNSLVYYHMFRDNLDEETLTDQELEEIKKEVKTKYKEISNRVIVPGYKFGKRFHLATKPLARYDKNMLDSGILSKYNSGSTIHIIIFLHYTFEQEKEGEYLGILRLNKVTSIYKNADWIKESVK